MAERLQSVEGVGVVVALAVVNVGGHLAASFAERALLRPAWSRDPTRT